MKKIVLLFMSAMALSMAISCNKEDNSPIIEFKDPLVLQALLDPINENFDKNGDGQISQKEANDARSQYGGINLQNWGIRSFDEISYFQNIEGFYLDGNQLTSIDVSKNTKLKSLSISNNQLTTLDVSKNTALEFLDCSANKLSALDVSKNTVLESLDCSTNKLSALDVSKNTALYSLLCYNTQLMTLDVSKNVALRSLAFSNNQITSIDLSNNTDLETLHCANNNLTILDLRKNKLLARYESLVEISGNPLQKLILSYYGLFPEKLKEKYKDIIEYVYE